MPHPSRSAISTGATFLAVLLVYCFFATEGPGGGYYERLSEGFRSGHLSIVERADPRLAALPDPYDPQARMREHIPWVWDASYFEGRYYLYFTPLPVLLFYLPVRIIAGSYPPDSWAAVFFCAWSLLVAVLFLRRALPEKRHVPLALWTIFAGLGSVVPLSLANVRIYEVAEMCGMAMSITWAWALLRFMMAPGSRTAAWAGLWLGLAIAARPNLGILLVPTILALSLSRKDRQWIPAARALVIPLIGIGIAMAAYNYARFHDPLEFGTTYQLTSMSMKGVRVCSVCTPSEVLRVVNNGLHYLFWSPVVHSRFPFLVPQVARLDPAVSWRGGDPQTVVGVAAIMPLALVGAAFAILLALTPGAGQTEVRAANRVMLGGWLVILALSTCWWIVARYSLDFMLLLAASAAVSIENGLTLLERVGVRILPLRVVVGILLAYSVVVGVLLGF